MPLQLQTNCSHLLCRQVYTSILKQRWQHFMVRNGYLNASIQKAFVDGIPGCSEYHLKLLAMIEEAHWKHKSISI